MLKEQYEFYLEKIKCDDYSYLLKAKTKAINKNKSKIDNLRKVVQDNEYDLSILKKITEFKKRFNDFDYEIIELSTGLCEILLKGTDENGKEIKGMIGYTGNLSLQE